MYKFFLNIGISFNVIEGFDYLYNTFYNKGIILFLFKEEILMIQGNATLVVDLGNSSTKGMVLFGKDSQTGKFRERSFDLSNQFAIVSPDYEVPSDYSDTTSTVLTIDAEVNGKPVKGTFCNGEVQQKEKPTGILRPTATRKKYELDTTALSFELAFLYGYKAIMDMQRVSDFSQLDITWKVVTLLPPGDIDGGKEKIEEIIKSIKSINTSYPVCNLPVNIERIAVLPEGYCAYIAVVYDKGHVYRPDYKFLNNETVIVFDVGAGTTDCMLVSEGKLVQTSRLTVGKGGNNVFQIVKRDLELQGLTLDDSDIQRGVIKGFVKDGSKKIPIDDIVNKAKSEVASIIIEEFTGYLERTDIKVRSIGYVLVCGGGSMNDSDCEEIKPLSEGLVNNFKELSPNVSLIDIPTHVVSKVDETNEDGVCKKVEEKISPRDLNLIGASILAELL